MSLENRVVWSEGIFLRPQHFQQQDRWVEAQVRGAVRDLCPFGWGFRKLVLDVEALGRGEIHLLEADGVWRDGTPLRIPADSPPPAPLTLDKTARAGIVHLGLPHRVLERQTIEPVDAPASGARYRAARVPVGDVVGPAGSAEEPIEVAHAQLRLMTEQDDRSAYSCLGVMKLLAVGEDRSIERDPSYLPPCLRLEPAAPLVRFLAELAGKLEATADELVSWVAGRRAEGVAEMRDLYLLQVINRNEPLIHHLAAQRGLHPETVYRALIGLVGEFATFTHRERRAPRLPVYDHDDLASTFEPVMTELRRSLAEPRPRKVVKINVRAHPRPGVYSVEVPENRVYEEARLVMAVGAALGADELRQRFPRAVTLGPINEFDDLVKRNLRGIPLVPRSLPGELPLYPGREYFELDRDNPYWQRLPQSRGLGMLVASDIPEPAIDCWAIWDTG